jgi:formylglycine-generating enzyme required for sulfatase activity
MPNEVGFLVSMVEASGVTLEQRIDAAHRLAAIGDPRLAASRVHVSGASFLVDRYPVTVAAFGAFIEAEGYTDERWWTREGWAWRETERIAKPRFWGEAEWAPYLVGNHPVVGVSYYEAEAYAAFAGARLPTEVEWELACGPRPRKYPWGDAWVDDACGMRGYGPRSTVPVGIFPRGRSPYGTSDLVGCVWQWCTDAFVGWGEKDEPTDDAEPRRTTCGGAWNTLAWSLTCQSRNGFPKSARFSNLGFRCVVDE